MRWAWLVVMLAAGAALAANPSASMPIDGNSVRVEWDGRGELVLYADAMPRRIPLGRATRRGPGVSWFYPPMNRGDMLFVAQEVNGRSAGGHKIRRAETHPFILWCGPEPPAAVSQRDGLGSCCQEHAGRLSWLSQAEDLPPWAPALAGERFVVLATPLSSDVQFETLQDYAAAGGCLVVCQPQRNLGQWRYRVPPLEPVPGEPGQIELSAARFGRGAWVEVAGPPPKEAAYWQRVAMAAGIGSGDVGSERWCPLPSAYRLTRAMDETRAFPAGALVGFVALYLLLLGPVAWRLRRDAWLWTPLLALLGVAGAVLWVQRTDGGSTHAYVLSVTRCETGQSAAVTETTVRLNSRSGGEYWLDTPTKAPPEGLGHRVEGAGQPVWGPWRLPVRAARTGGVEQRRYWSYPIELKVRQEGERLVGTIRQSTSATLRGAALVWNHQRLAHLGDLRSDVVVELGPRLAWHARDYPRHTRWLTELLCGRDAPPAARGLVTAFQPLHEGIKGKNDEYFDPPTTTPAVELLGWLDGPDPAGQVLPGPVVTTRLHLLHVLHQPRWPGCDIFRARASCAVALPGENGNWTARAYELNPRPGDAERALLLRGAPRQTRLWNVADQRWDRMPASGRVPRAADYLREGDLIIAFRGGRERPEPSDWAPRFAPEGEHGHG